MNFINPVQPLEQTRAEILFLYQTWKLTGQIELNNEIFIFGQKAFGFVSAIYLCNGYGFEFLFNPKEIEKCLM